MARYALANHVFLCISGEHLVFLDLKEDRYFALEAAVTAGLDFWVNGWPVKASGQPQDEQSPTPEAAEVLEVLQGRGLLETAIPPGKGAS